MNRNTIRFLDTLHRTPTKFPMRVFGYCFLHTSNLGVVTLSFSGRKGQGLVDIQAKQAAIFHASKASRRW